MDRLILSLMVALLCSVSYATTKGIQIVARDGEQVGHYENSYALLIGVSDYTAGWPDLQAVPSELSQVETMLQERGFAVTRVLNPQSSRLKSAFESFVNEHGYDTNSRLLFYFSGHGYTRDNGNKGYLVPTDAPDPRRDERGFLQKSYAMVDLLALARKLESNHALFLFDSCFSGTIFKTKALPDTPPLISNLTSRPVRQFITAGDAGEQVPAKSVFTPAFIEAIEYGTGDLNKDGYVTGSELGMHLQSVVSNSVHQTPQYGKITDFDLSRGDFVFATLNRSTVSVLSTPLPEPPKTGQGVDTFLDKMKQENESRAKQEREIKSLWEKQQSEMRIAYRDVEAFVNQSNVSGGQKRQAWEFFLSSYTDDNPYSSEDDDLRRQARREMQSTELQDVLRDGSLGPEMVIIKAGRFRMGDIDGGGDDDEKPVHQVVINQPFGMGKYEVKVGEFRHFVDSTSYLTDAEKSAGGSEGCRVRKDGKWQWDGNASWRDPGYSQAENDPVVCISWRDTKAYIEWLSVETDKRYRLPTEAEWEYAARSGSTTKYHFGNSESSLCRYANGADKTPLSSGTWKNKADCRDGYGDVTAPAGSFQPNQFGLYDMHGNVWEWVEGCYHKTYQGAPNNGSAWASGSCGSRVLRGGSWYNIPRALRSAYRDWSSPGNRLYIYGFRLAQDL